MRRIRALGVGTLLMLAAACRVQQRPLGEEPGSSGRDGSGGAPVDGGTGEAGSSGSAAGQSGSSGSAAGQGGSSGSAAGQGGSSGSAAGQGGSGGSAASSGDGGEGSDERVLRCVRPGRYCQSTDNCPWHKRCDDERCVPVAEGSACSTSDDCGNAQYCKRGACKNRAPILPDEDCMDAADAGRTCPEGSECWSVTSITSDPPDHRCFDVQNNVGLCDQDGPSCKPGYYCPSYWDSDPQPCIKRGTLGESCFQEQPLACEDGLSCNFGKCQPAEAAEGSGCEPDISLKTRHRLPLPRACAAGLYCQKVGPSEGKCAPAKPIDSECESWTACLNGYCKAEPNQTEGTCAALAVDKPCGADLACPDNAYCGFFSGTCGTTIPIGESCNDNPGACVAGSECHYVGGKRICVKAAALDEDCTDSFCKPDVYGATAPICVHVEP